MTRPVGAPSFAVPMGTEQGQEPVTEGYNLPDLSGVKPMTERDALYLLDMIETVGTGENRYLKLMRGVLRRVLARMQRGRRFGESSPALLRIAKERVRQITEEQWSPEHDDEHADGSLALAAVCYASPVELFRRDERRGLVCYSDPWPATWARHWDKREPRPVVDRQQRIRELEKAGALIAAEIDRLLRRRRPRGDEDRRHAGVARKIPAETDGAL